MNTLLDPRKDIVFKLFFIREKNKPFLMSFIETVIRPSSPIVNLEVLNPSLPKNRYDEKAPILDLLIELENKTKICIEMQMNPKPGFRSRILYYWAKTYSGQIKAGENYKITPAVISISVLNYIEFKEFENDVHSIFKLREIDKGYEYTKDLELHFIELPKIFNWSKQNDKNNHWLNMWVLFFKLVELDKNAIMKIQQEPLMNKAIKALEELSHDAEAREEARVREKSEMDYYSDMSGAFDEGMEKGIEKGIKRSVQALAFKGFTAIEISEMLELNLKEVENILSL